MLTPQLLTSLPPQPVISLSSPLHFPVNAQFTQPQVIPVQQPHQVIFGGQPVLPQQPQQKYKVIQVVVPTRIADQVLHNTQQKYQLLPAPPEAQAATLDGARVGPPMPVPGFITPAPLPPPPRPQQVVQVQPQFQHAQVQLAAGQPLPPGAAILLPAAAAAAATPFPM